MFLRVNVALVSGNFLYTNLLNYFFSFLLHTVAEAEMLKT
jgi:hypothetical protein